MHEQRLNAEQRALEASLAALSPTLPTTDTAELMFDLGRRAERRRTRRWQLGSSVLGLLLAGTLAASFVQEPETVTIVEQRVVETPPTAPAAPEATAASPATRQTQAEPPRRAQQPWRLFSGSPPRQANPHSMGALRHVALTQGVDALPTQSFRLPDEARTPAALTRELLSENDL